jgi:hypothetical protein
LYGDNRFECTWESCEFHERGFSNGSYDDLPIEVFVKHNFQNSVILNGDNVNIICFSNDYTLAYAQCFITSDPKSFLNGFNVANSVFYNFHLKPDENIYGCCEEIVSLLIFNSSDWTLKTTEHVNLDTYENGIAHAEAFELGCRSL